MPVNLRLNPPKLRSPRDGRLILEFESVDNAIWNIETAIINVLLSCHNERSVVLTDYPYRQILMPLTNLHIRLSGHKSALEEWGVRVRVMDSHEARCAQYLSSGTHSQESLARRLSSILEKIPKVDQAYVRSFSDYHSVLVEIEQRVIKLTAFLDSIVNPVPATAEQLIIRSNLPFAVEPTVLPEGTPLWKVKLAQYGVHNLSSEGDRFRILRRGGEKAQQVLDDVHSCMEACLAYRQRAMAKHITWQNWKALVADYEAAQQTENDSELTY